jgi:hypothetical protein
MTTEPARRSPQEVLAEAIAATSPAVDSDGAVCTGWVLVAEWVGSDGGYLMSRLCDGTSPVWRVKGLLCEALDDWPARDGDE